MPKSKRPGSRISWSRSAGALTLTLILLALPGCQSLRALTGSSVSSALPPITRLLTVQPMETRCQMESGKIEPCVVLLKADWDRTIIELKAACFKLGGTAADCDPPVVP